MPQRSTSTAAGSVLVYASVLMAWGPADRAQDDTDSDRIQLRRTTNAKSADAVVNAATPRFRCG